MQTIQVPTRRLQKQILKTHLKRHLIIAKPNQRILMFTLVLRPFRPIPERLKFQPTPVLYLMAELNLLRKMMLIPILILKT